VVRKGLVRRIRRLRRRPEAGFTLIEMVITVSILSLVLIIVTSVLFSVQSSFSRETIRSDTNDQARLAVQQLDREVRSGNLLYNPYPAAPLPPWASDPANGIYPGMSLLIYTQTNATTQTPGNRCVQWRIMNQQLQSRDWSTEWRTDDIVDPWRVIATGIQNQVVNPQVSAFTLDPDTNKGGRTMVVTLLVNTNTTSNTTNGNTESFQLSVTGRNTSYGYPSTVCTDIPPYS
jgi:prepilin-type N-terminal cleavage/methylation domain-containing protein